MARKKNKNITLDDIKRVGPVKFILLVIVAAIFYFTGIDPSSIFNNNGNDIGGNHRLSTSSR